MTKLWSSLIVQFKNFYKNLTPTKRMSMIASLGIVLAAITIVSVMMSSTSFVPMMKDVSSESLPLVIEKLKSKNIPFKVEEGGKTISVPPEHVYTTQMALMTELGTSHVGNIGLELFDKQDLGATSYVQRINYQRALQGELMRAINSLDAVKKSKVLLALPPKKTFLEEAGKTTASVTVDLHPGKTLSEDQVRGITNLVASSVENLIPENVTVVDSRGKVLSKNNGDSVSAMSLEMMELKEKTERQLESRIEGILTRVVGQGKVIAKVNADINSRDVVSVEEIIDPDKTAVKSTITEDEKLNGNRRNPTGVPGARANLPGAEEGQQVAFNQDVSKEYKTINYDVPKTVRNIKEAPGAIERISISVVVDGVMENIKKEDGTFEKQYKQRSPEELQKYASLVRGAIGFSEKRGDTFTIENMPFEQENFEEAEQILNSLERRKLFSYMLKWGIIGLAFLLFFFVVVRPFMRWITDNFQESVEELLPKTIEELEELQSVDNTLPGMSAALPTLEESIDPDKAESELLKDRILGLVGSNNKKAADALGLWLVRRDS
ncbi:MAG: flagellar basal-body MS-ring/collar protein FliF [Bdellovibrionota bacterium]